MRTTNGLGADQARRYVGPDLGPNCLRMLRQTTLVGKELNIRAVRQLRLLPNVNFQGLLAYKNWNQKTDEIWVCTNFRCLKPCPVAKSTFRDN